MMKYLKICCFFDHIAAGLYKKIKVLSTTNDRYECIPPEVIVPQARVYRVIAVT